MKTRSILAILLSLLSASAVFCQSIPEKPKNKKNAVSLEFYQPIQNSIREFYNDDWLLSTYPSERNSYSRNSFSNAFGISYEKLHNDVVFRARVGITVRNTTEHQGFENINAVDNYTTNINQESTYRQNHINVFIGIAKRINLVPNFDLDFGIDLASICYLKGKGKYSYDIVQQNTIDNSLLYHQRITVDDAIGKMYGFGLGPVLKPQYRISKNIIVAMEFQVYFMNTFTTDKSTRLEISDAVVPPGTTEHIELYGDIKYDVNQWNWTKISPLIRIGYEF